MPHKKGHNIFDLVNRVPGRTNPNIVPGGSSANTMSMDDPNLISRPGPREEYGQEMQGPGSQSGSESFIDYNIGGGNIDAFQDINNMNDLYDWWVNEGQDSSSSYGNAGGYDNFMDWFNSWNETYGGGGFTPSADYGTGHPNTWMAGYNSQTGGSQQGGTGDLGTGSNFAGGGMGNSMFGEGITNPFGAGFGPEGQYDMGGSTGVDESMMPDESCYDAWVASGAADSYEDFAAGMC